MGPFIFLDIDGVLNSRNAHANGYCPVCPACVKPLNGIIERTGAKVIVISAWRYFVLRNEMTLDGFRGLMCTHGLKFGCILDVVGPDIEDFRGGADRAKGITRWFERRFGIAHKVNYAILDDMDLGYTRAAKMPWFPVDGRVGLCGEPTELIDRIEAQLLRGEHPYGWKFDR